MNRLSTKVTASALAGAVSTLFWIIMVDTVWQHTFSPNELSALVASTTTILAFLIGFFFNEKSAYIREWVKRNPNDANAACAELVDGTARSKDDAAATGPPVRRSAPGH